MSKYISQKFTKEEIVAKLEECISVYQTTGCKYHTYSALLNSRGLYAQYIDYWIKVKQDEDITIAMTTLRRLQEDKLREGLIDNKSNVNTVGALFLLKCNHGYMEADKREKLEIERAKLEQQNNIIDTVGSALNITFTTAEHRSEEDIQKLLDSKE